MLTEEVGWINYGGKHHESMYTGFFQSYILTRKFNIDKQTVLAFNLYNLGESRENNIYNKERANFANITSLTAIANFSAGKWSLTVVETILDNDIKTDISYREGHKKYILWDFYQFNENDKNLKLIFKVEDRFNEYFEIFSANQNNENLSKYQIIHRFNPLFDKDADRYPTSNFNKACAISFMLP